MHDFHPLIAKWFTRRFSGATEPQRQAWPPIRAGRHVLISAPTGLGKTLAAFLICLDGLVRAFLDGALQILKQLQGYEISAAAWEPDVLRRRVARYDPELLDMLCLSGEVMWGRLSPHPAFGNPRSASPVPTSAQSQSRNPVDDLALAATSAPLGSHR